MSLSSGHPIDQFSVDGGGMRVVARLLTKDRQWAKRFKLRSWVGWWAGGFRVSLDRKVSSIGRARSWLQFLGSHYNSDQSPWFC